MVKLLGGNQSQDIGKPLDASHPRPELLPQQLNDIKGSTPLQIQGRANLTKEHGQK